MPVLDWLDENQERDYPFVTGSPAGQYKKVVVDATFVLGPDFDFDLNDETSELRLTSVAMSGVDWLYSFRHYQGGSLVSGSPTLTFSIGNGAQLHSTHYAQTPNGASHGYITVSSIGLSAVESPGAVVEPRTLVAVGASAAPTVKVYNAKRRQSLKPYFSSDPTKTPGQNYNAAKAAAGAFTPGVVQTPGVTMTGQTISISGGYNCDVTGDPVSDVVTVRLAVGGGRGQDCRPVPSDLLNQTIQGALRSLNGQKPNGGNLLLRGGSKVTIIPDPENFRIRIVVGSPLETGDCPPRRRDTEIPPEIDDPPGDDSGDVVVVDEGDG